eukprot:g29411.t1
MNCMGTFIQVGFATLSALSLQPLMCYQHPNGLYSVLKYPSTFCGHSEQVIMIAIGMVLMTIFVLGFFAACSLAAWKMPTWSLEKNHRWVQSFTFLTGKFRLDAWYFGTPLLLRGLGLGVTVALGTDRPEVQISLASVVILLYLCTLVRVWPWKARVLNVADTALSAGMLLLVPPPTPSDHANDAPGDVSEEDSEDMANRKIGLVDDQPTQSEMIFNSTISACEKGSQWQQGISLFEAMTKHKVSPDFISCGAVISCCEKGAQWQQALQRLAAFFEQKRLPSGRDPTDSGTLETTVSGEPEAEESAPRKPKMHRSSEVAQLSMSNMGGSSSARISRFRVRTGSARGRRVGLFASCKAPRDLEHIDPPRLLFPVLRSRENPEEEHEDQEEHRWNQALQWAQVLAYRFLSRQMCAGRRPREKLMKLGISLYIAKYFLAFFLLCYALLNNKAILKEEERSFSQSLQENNFSVGTLLLIVAHMTILLSDRIFFKAHYSMRRSQSSKSIKSSSAKELVNLGFILAEFVFLHYHTMAILWTSANPREATISLASDARGETAGRDRRAGAGETRASWFGRSGVVLVHGVVGPEDLRTEEKLWYYFFLVHYNLPFVDDLRVIVDWTVVPTSLDLWMYWTCARIFYNGWAILCGVVLVILMPIIVFSPFSPFPNTVLVEHADMALGMTVASSCYGASRQQLCRYVELELFAAPALQIQRYNSSQTQNSSLVDSLPFVEEAMHASPALVEEVQKIMDEATTGLDIAEDRRMTHCQVCLAKLTCPALSRHEMMLQFTGQELASLVREQSLISSSQAWSDALFHHLRRVADRRSINNFVHWSRSSYLIYNCGPKQLALSIPDEANREAVLDNLDSAGHLEIQGKQYRLLREGPLAPSSPPSEPTTDVADVSSPSLFQAISDAWKRAHCIRAVNLSKAISEEDLSVEVQLLLRRAMKAAKIDSLPRAFPSLGIALGRDLAAALRATAPPAAPAATEPSAPSPAPEPEPPVAEPVAKRQRVEEVAEDTGIPEAHEPEEDVASASASEFSDFWGLTADVAPDLPDDDGSASDGSALEGPDAADMVVSVAAESIYDVAGSMRIEGTEGAEPTLRIFWGEARWQRTQLLGELARDLVKGEGDP